MVRIAIPRSFQRLTGLINAARKYETVGIVSLFSTSPRLSAYADTIPNLKIGPNTRVLFQGFTGRQATINAKECIDYGTNVVGGVKPGTEGEHLGLPVVPSVKAAVERLRPDASAVYVPGSGTVTAIEEAIENEIPLVVAVAEHIPIHDVLRIHEMLRTQSKTRLVGANCPGIINTHGRCRIGFQPLPFFQEGRIGIVAKSGTLGYETVASTTRAGLGQSYAISVGGDVVAGTTFVEALQILEQDEKTEGIIMVGEIGGRTEEDAAEWIMDYRRRTPRPKPVMALIGGIEAPRGRIMGHAGAWAGPGEADSAQKIKILERAGVTVVKHPEDFGDGMKTLLGVSSGSAKRASGQGAMQRRYVHAMRRRSRPHSNSQKPIQKRNLYIKREHAFDMLKEQGIGTSETPPSSQERLLAVSIDRTQRSPCIVASPTTTDLSETNEQCSKFPFAYGSDGATTDAMLDQVSKHIGIDQAGLKALRQLIAALADIFTSKEGTMIQTKFSMEGRDKLRVHSARFAFDDAAIRSSGRQKDVHALRDKSVEPEEELAAEKEGMIYVKLDGVGSVGTIVNGAGLAMNTVDALVQRGGHPANFLDTGGKATKDTIKAAFRCVASDPRVKAIFVNICGGLTRCDMIAEGVMLAFKGEGVTVPVVVRLRGTNEKEGQQMVRSSPVKKNPSQ